MAWQRFLDWFSPLDPRIDWFLFQAPPQVSNLKRFISFFSGLPGLDKGVLEIRNKNLLLDDAACLKLQDYLPLVSVDFPDCRNRIFDGNCIYMRMHGRENWYQYEYSQKELEETVRLILSTGAKRAYISSTTTILCWTMHNRRGNYSVYSQASEILSIL